MEITVEQNRTLIVQGPATLTPLEGRASCLGVNLATGFSLTIRRFKALPIYCTTQSRFEIKRASHSSLEEVEGDTIPEDWKTAAQTIIEASQPPSGLTVAVVGAVDVGKSTFTTFLANTAFQAGLRVRVIDADLGQSDIGPPTTIGEYTMRRTVCDLYREKPDRLTFIGATSPAYAATKLLKALQELSQRDKAEGGLKIFNTDGWVEGGEAAEYKRSVLQAIDAGLTVAVRYAEELDALLEKVREAGCKLITISTPPVVRRRSRGERRELREQTYLKYLQNSSVRVVHSAQLKFRGRPLWVRGVLLGLFSGGQFLGIGILDDYDLQRGLVKVRTPVKERIAELEFGQVAIERGEEVPIRTYPPLRNDFKSGGPV